MTRENAGPVRLVKLGRVLKPHGLKGELCVELYAESPFVFDCLQRLYLQLPEKKPKPCVLESWREHQGRALLVLDRSQGRDQADAWRGAEVLVRVRDLGPENEDGLSAEVLRGLAVWHVDGRHVGVLEDIQDVAGQEMWFIRDTAGHEILLPAVDEFVRDIDVHTGIIEIDPPEGLLELYQHA